MIGIYKDSFIKLLKDSFGENNVKIKSKNIVVQCPWCEYQKKKSHYHLWISLEAPIFHCFEAGCPKKSGFVSDLIKKINGVDVSDKYIDSSLVDNKKIKSDNLNKSLKQLKIPLLDEDKFKLKTLYIKKRLGFNIEPSSIKNIIFDIDEFIDSNRKYINDKSIELRKTLQSNFIGFITENHSMIFFRNINSESSFRHYKIKMQDSLFIDYYRLNGINSESNHIVLAEGVFDIWSEYIFDSLKLKNSVKTYASVLSPNYKSLIKSIIYNENIYRVKISILSDRDVPLDYYKKLKYFNNHIIDSLTVYYNEGGKDFNDFPLVPIKFII